MTIPDFSEFAGMEQADAQVIRKVLAGDVEAFGLLVDRHHARCLRTATHLLGDADEAEDAVQESFVRAYRHLGSYRERDRFGAWLLRIVVNQCRSRAAFERRWRRFDADGESALAGRNAVEHACIDSDRRAELAYALGQLDESHREAIVLRFAEELSFDQISAITGVGVSALKMRVHRGCARLRALLSEHIHA